MMLFWLTLVIGLSTGQSVSTPRPISFDTPDGARIAADVYGRGDNAVILAHGAVFDKESWKPLAETLAQQGHLVMAIDFRGHGASTAGQNPRALEQDVLAGIRYLRTGGARTVSVVGASMGGGASARAAVAAKAGEIDRLLLLSPVAIANPEAIKAGSILYLASRNEAMASSIEKQFALAPEPKRLVLLDGSAHAQNIFKSAEAGRLTTTIVEFLGARSK